jgi:hypothetical protein
MDDNNIHRMPSIKDREFKRVTEQVYFYCEPIEMDNNNMQSSTGFTIPTFVQEEDDLVGLSIDAFREQILLDDPKHKEYYLDMQQLLSMFKRFIDAELLGREQNLFKKVEVNISSSGLAFPSDVAYRTEQFLRLNLFFPKKPLSYLSLIGEVVRSEKAEIGYDIRIHFHEITPEAQKKILEFVEHASHSSN